MAKIVLQMFDDINNRKNEKIQLKDPEHIANGLKGPKQEHDERNKPNKHYQPVKADHNALTNASCVSYTSSVLGTE